MAEENWSVTVSVNGDPIVTIEPRCLSGVDHPDEAAIRAAAHSLLAFIGDPPPPEKPLRAAGG